MARRRKLETPTAADLDKLEAEFRRETPALASAAPIAQVAADAAAQSVVDPAARAKQVQDGADAQALQQAKDDGRLIVEIPLQQIDTTTMTRDRLDMDKDAFEELKVSLQVNGLRLPIEVYAIETADGAPKFGLISGYRRLFAYQELSKIYSESFQSIKALVRDRSDAAHSFTAMVEENEIRENLSHFERGRIASLAAQQNAFANTEAAVDALFGTASKAKRSKIRSFALIFESLGDLLIYPKDLREKDGLQISNALRLGAEKRLRQTLDDASINTAEEERSLLLAVAAEFLEQAKEPARGGRPKKIAAKPGWVDDETVVLSSGVSLQHDHDGSGHFIRVKGSNVDRKLMKEIVAKLQFMLDQP